MRKYTRVSCLLFIFSVLLLLLSQTFTVWAASDDYYISDIVIKAAIDNRGDMIVEETFDYVFKDSFNGIKRNVKTNGSDGIEDITVEVFKNNVSEKGNFEVNKSNGAVEIKIYSKSSNEQKTFKIKYRLKNVVTKYSDISELKWLFYENEDDVATNKITVFLTLPNSITSEVKYLGEGPKRGQASLDGERSIKLQLDKMKDDEVIGAQVLFPSNWISTTKTIAMNRDDYYSKIKEQRNKTAAIIILCTAGIITFISTVIYLDAKKRRRAIEEYRGDYIFFNEKYYSQLPGNLSPALVSMLINGSIGTKDMLAAILNLAGKEAITFLDNPIYDRDYKNLSFTINNYMGNYRLSENEKYLLEWLSSYAVGGVIYLSLLQKNAGKAEFISRYSQWKDLVSKEAEKLNFYTVIRAKKILTNQYEDERRKWVAFKRYLCDSGDGEVSYLKERGLWDCIVPYAIALDAMEKVLDYIHRDNYHMTNNMLMNYWFLHYYTSTYKRDFDNSYSNNSNSSGNFSGSGGGGFGGGGGSSAF